jgi:putative colanic acid biosynthesis acetyltransferase WcaF
MLRLFGAQIGTNVRIRNRTRIHFPWNLQVGNDCWIGEEVWFINHEKVTIGSNVCISQRSIICSGGHDYRSASLEYAHKPIEIKDGAWICLDAKVLAGVTIGECSVVSAGEVVRKSLPDFSMLVDGQIRPIDPPK